MAPNSRAVTTMRAVVSMALILPLAIQAAPDTKHVAQVRRKIESSMQHASRVVIETYDARRLQGSVSEARVDSFILTNDGRSTTLTYEEVRRVFASAQVSKPVTAILIGGVVAGVLLALVWALGGLRG